MATADDVISQLQNIARQLGAQAQSQSNATPNATASTSPVSIVINNLGTASGTVIVAANTDRYGLIMHNPGTANIYVYPTLMSGTPTTALLGGTFVVYGGGTLSFPSPLFANVNCGWSAFSGTGSNQPFTVVEFY